ncbi:acyl-CoA dehydrogenase family protein [Victivallis vadensis]|uniref:acyl-CoA dehydrogenase family protein n=1 Tax=Victivallis vadensis TaxID=172901 RepID=UPI0026DB5378|nr:acyl-CoA dehydrogenase family protein [Victivallis vadensis]
MANFFKDNADLMFTLNNLELAEVAKLKEEGYKFAQEFDNAPADFADALDNYNRVLEVVGEICGDRIEPRSRTVDAEGPHFADGVVTYHPLTVQNLNDLKQAGVMGVMLDHKFGGLNFPVSVYTMMTEMVSRADGSLQNIFGLQDIAETINFFGSDEQKEKYLPGFASGEYDGSMDLTEPDFGSDLQAVRLRAWQDEKTGQWYLNGMKRFITNGCAKVHLVLARSEEGTSDGRGLSMFICEACPQLVVRRIENKLGIHGVATTELQYNDVPAVLCGKRRFGLIKYVMSLMNGARVAISGQAIGIAEAAYREARKYAAERMQFKKSIDQFPAIYDMLAGMKVKLTAARALLYETTRVVDLRNGYTHLVEHGENVSADDRAKQKYYNKVAAVLTPMCKALATEMANQVAYDAIQIHGGTGFMKDFNAERFYRDARITNIYEGTTQLQVVAAIGGVIQRDNDVRIQELASLDYTGKLARLRDTVMKLHARQLEAVKFVAEKKDPAYHDLMARSLVEMETYIFVGLLLLRDAMKCEDRAAIAERFILDAVPEFEKRFMRVTSGDVTLIDNKRDIIDY